jgi:hypothetical protein
MTEAVARRSARRYDVDPTGREPVEQRYLTGDGPPPNPVELMGAVLP